MVDPMRGGEGRRGEGGEGREGRGGEGSAFLLSCCGSISQKECISGIVDYSRAHVHVLGAYLQVCC